MTSVSVLAIGILVLLGLLVVMVGIGVVVGVSTVIRRERDRGSNPNLFPCPDCELLVSIRAPFCPHCGAPLKNA